MVIQSHFSKFIFILHATHETQSWREITKLVNGIEISEDI